MAGNGAGGADGSGSDDDGGDWGGNDSDLVRWLLHLLVGFCLSMLQTMFATGEARTATLDSVH